MTSSLLEKAREGRISALASLENRAAKAENVVSLFDLDFVNKRQKPAIQFVSSRTVEPEERLAA